VAALPPSLRPADAVINDVGNDDPSVTLGDGAELPYIRETHGFGIPR
jgi:hypothetical protein